MAENLLGTPVIYTLPGRDIGIQPGSYDFNIKEPMPVNEHGEAYKGFARGVDQLQQLSYGGLAALSDVAGADSVRDWAYGKAREQDYEMERNAPAVAQFTDIESISDAYNWFVGTAAEMVPTSAVIGLISLATGIGGGAAASLATRPAIRTLVGSSIKKMVQQGMTQEAATIAALRGLGAYIGGASSSAFMEAGGNYLEDVKLHGIEGADAGRDILWGIPAGLVEVGLGPETRTISKALTGAVSKEVKEAAERGVLKSLGRSALKGGLGEGGEEVGQNFLGRIATRQDPFTDPQDYFNQFMGGVAGGLIPGLGEGLVDKYNANKEVRVAAAVKAIKDKIAETETTPEQKLNNAKQEQTLALTNLNISTQQNIAELDKSEQELKSNQVQLMHRLTELYQDQTLDPAIKQQFADEWENELYAIAAQLATLKDQRVEYMESAKAEAKKLQKKYTNIINENEIEQIKDAPASIRDFYTKGQDEIKQHIGLGVLEQHVSNELRKANDRIDQYTSARNEVARQIETQQYVGPMFVQGEQIGQQGNIPQYNEVEILNWYDKQIADERKYIDKLSSAYEEALIANRKANSDPYTAEVIASKVYDHFRPAKLASTNIDNIHNQYADKIAKQAKAQYKEDFLNWRTQASPSMGEKFAEYKANKQEVAARRMERKAAIRNEAARLAGHMPAEANTLANTITKNKRLQDFINDTLVNKDVNASVPITDRQIRNFGNQFTIKKETTNKPNKLSTKLMTPEVKRTSGNIDKIQKVINWISNTLDKLPALSGRITVTHTADLSTLPDNVQKAYKGSAALIDVNKGQIYLFADKIATKEQAVRKVLHEGVAHFGLRSIMNNKQLKEFLKLVNVSFKDSEFFKKVKATYPDYDEISVAEEFVAALAERIKLNQKTMSRTAAAYIRVKQFIKRILQELGLINVTEKDVNDVLLASVYNLSVAQERINRTPRAKSSVKDIKDQRVWHGSPHYFTKFDLSHIGSGEGAQAYGYGLYFADEKSVGEFYRKSLGKKSIDGVSLEQFYDTRPAMGSVYDALRWLKDRNPQATIDDAAKFYDEMKPYRDERSAVDALMTYGTEAAAKKARPDIAYRIDELKAEGRLKIDDGQLYEVEIPDDEHLMFWDKPLSEQPEAVKKALEKGGIGGGKTPEPYDGMDLGGGSRLKVTPGGGYFLVTGSSEFRLSKADVERLIGKVGEEKTGQRIYQELVEKTGSDRAASEYLRSLGIPGHKYLDGTSRRAGEGTYNYVIYDDSTIDIRNILESRDIVADKDWVNTRSTKEYKNKFQKTYDAVKKALGKPAAYLKDGILRLDAPTMRDKFVERMQNNVLRMDRLVHGIKDLGGVISNKTNIHEIEKTLSSKISNTTLDFMDNMFGISDKRYAEPKEGTLMWLGSQLIDDKKIKKENLLKVMSLVLQAVHAPEANKAIRERYKAIRSMNAKIDSYNKALESGALDAEDVIEIETKISKLQDKIASTKKSYGKMWTAPSGMSDEVAAKILKAFVTKENAKIWDLVFKKNQEINKYILDILVEAKLLDKETRELWDRIYPNYVPLKEWEASMALADPSYTQWATGRSLSIGTWVPSKLRTGRTALASNSVVQLLRKAQDAIAVSIRSELDKSLIKLIEDNEKLLSGIFEIDMMPEELELRKQVKELMAKNRELLGDKITSIKDIMKDLYRGRNELKDRKVRLEKQFMSRKSDAAKEKVKVKLDKINADIQNATDAIETLKAQRKALLESNEVSAMQKALAAKRTELKRVLDTKGYKIIRNPDGTTSKVRKAKYFEGVQNTRAGLGTGTITAVDENGIRRRVWIKDPNLYAAWTGKNIPSWALHPILKYTSIILRTMAKFFTTWNPEFIFTNMFRDMQTASIHIRHLAQDIKRLGIDANELTKRAAKNYKDAAKAMWHYERGTLAETDPWYPIVKMFKKHGGYTTMYNMGTFKKSYNDLQQAIENISNPSATTKVKKGLMNVMGYIEDASTAMENATRLAAFKAISEAMIENNVSAEEAYSRAANASLDLTVNFTKKGTWGPALSSLYLFANASIQSTARMMKAMFPASDKGKPILKRRITRYAGGIMLASFLVAEAGRGIGGDDDDGISHYDKVNEWSRNTNMIIMGPGGKYVKIPLSYGYQIFWVMGQIMSDMLHGRMNISDSIRRMVASTVANFSPVAADEGWATFLPAQIKPLIQIQMNQNYLNNPIFPDKLPWERGEKPDSQKKWDSTNIALGAAFEWLNWVSGGSKDRSGLIDISPAAAEYVMGQYLGGIGKVALDSIDVAVKLLSGRTLDINPITDIPMVRRFAGETGKYATMHEYIKVKTEIETQMNEFNRIKKDKLPIEQAAKVRKMTAAGRLMNSRLTDVQQELKDIAERENKLMRSNMSIEYKTSAKKKFEEQKEKIMKRFIKAANKAGIK
jgi:hypothetical protein